MREQVRTVAMGGGNRNPDPTVGASDPRMRLEDAYRSFGAELWRAVYAFTGGLRHVTVTRFFHGRAHRGPAELRTSEIAFKPETGLSPRHFPE